MLRVMSSDAVIDTNFDAEPSDIWDAMTSPDGIQEWMGQGSCLPPVEDGELWLRDFVTGTPRHGRVRSVDPDRELSFEWWPEDDPSQPSTVSITLEPLHTGTRVRVIENVGPAAGGVQMSAAAWAWRSASLIVTVEHLLATLPFSTGISSGRRLLRAR